jgi:hypothetical protein
MEILGFNFGLDDKLLLSNSYYKIQNVEPKSQKFEKKLLLTTLMKKLLKF